MNDELQKAMAEILGKTVKGVEAGVGFLQRELPEVIQQLLIWHAVRSAVFFVLFTIASLACAYGLVRAIRWSNENDWDWGPVVLLPAIPTFLFALCALNNLDWLQILLAPKLYLIEYAASLVK